MESLKRDAAFHSFERKCGILFSLLDTESSGSISTVQFAKFMSWILPPSACELLFRRLDSSGIELSSLSREQFPSIVAAIATAQKRSTDSVLSSLMQQQLHASQGGANDTKRRSMPSSPRIKAPLYEPNTADAHAHCPRSLRTTTGNPSAVSVQPWRPTGTTRAIHSPSPLAASDYVASSAPPSRAKTPVKSKSVETTRTFKEALAVLRRSASRQNHKGTPSASGELSGSPRQPWRPSYLPDRNASPASFGRPEATNASDRMRSRSLRCARERARSYAISVPRPAALRPPPGVPVLRPLDPFDCRRRAATAAGHRMGRRRAFSATVVRTPQEKDYSDDAPVDHLRPRLQLPRPQFPSCFRRSPSRSLRDLVPSLSRRSTSSVPPLRAHSLEPTKSRVEHSSDSHAALQSVSYTASSFMHAANDGPLNSVAASPPHRLRTSSLRTCRAQLLPVEVPARVHIDASIRSSCRPVVDSASNVRYFPFAPSYGAIERFQLMQGSYR